MQNGRVERKQRTQIEVTIADLEKGLQIDRDDLEDAAAQQPDLFWRVSDRYEILISQRDQAKTELSEIEAAEDIRYRQSIPADEKVTEKEVASNVLLNPRVKAARDRSHKISAELGRWKALKESFEQRSYALNHLVELHMKNYYSSINREEKDATASRVREANHNQRRHQR